MHRFLETWNGWKTQEMRVCVCKGWLKHMVKNVPHTAGREMERGVERQADRENEKKVRWRKRCKEQKNISKSRWGHTHTQDGSVNGFVGGGLLDQNILN